MEVTIPAAVLGDAKAFLECKLESGQKIRISLAGMSLALDSANGPNGSDLPSATISNRHLVLVDDHAVVTKLRDHLRSRAAKGQLLDEEHATLLKTSYSRDPAEIDGAIVVFARRPALENAASAAMQPTCLLVARLYKDDTKTLYIEQSNEVPQDPGIAVRQGLLVQYSNLDNRWSLVIGTEKRTLAPKCCESLGEYFVDLNGEVCEAFYSGLLSSNKQTRAY